jgi:hypothetical protein
MDDKSMSLKLENIIVFTYYKLFKGVAHRRRALNKRQIVPNEPPTTTPAARDR